MPTTYSSPPIIEAVCEFRLTRNTAWDPAVPGLIYEQLKEHFPLREQRIIQEIQISGGTEGPREERRILERALFLTNDKRSFVQVGQHILAVNRLKPYLSWGEFKPQIELGFDTLSKVVEIAGLERIGLCYINRIEIPGERVDLDEYFDFRPFVGERLPQDLSSILLGCQFAFEEDRDRCQVRLRDAVADESSNSAFLLDIDYSTAVAESIRPAEALEWVDEAHQHVEDVFEGCISDALRTLFEEQR